LAADIEALGSQLESVCERALQLETRFAAEVAAVHPEFADSARNLLHYMALRHDDIRGLQDQLAQLGLSSLGQAEQHVLASIRIVQKALRGISGQEAHDLKTETQIVEQSRDRAEKHTGDLLGTNTDGRGVDIMVTLPLEAADDYQLVHDLIVTGMDIARINCAHDTSGDWLKMIENIRRASLESGKKCKIVMDLAGPKLRTGNLVPGPGVLRVRPRRDALGRVVSPNRVRFVADDSAWTGKKVAVVPVPRQCIEYADVGDELRFKDTRGRQRKVIVS
jgi:pyruvate kinase